MTGYERELLKCIIQKLIKIDDKLRKKEKTIFIDRKSVKIALRELKEAKGSKKGAWFVVRKEGLRIGDFDAPYQIYGKLSDNGLFGLSRAMCKAISLEGFTIEERTLARIFWNRCLLYHRRKVGGMKAAWKRRGYVVKYDEVPDLRECKYHEGAKLFYDLKEIKNDMV